jgi:hypothetical protein
MSTTLPTKRGSFNKHPDFNKKILVVDDEAAIFQTQRYKCLLYTKPSPRDRG